MILRRPSVVTGARGWALRTFTAVLVLCAALMAAGASAQPAASRPYKAHSIRSADGVTLAAQEWGNPSGPEIVFIHGFNQSHLSWARQVKSDLAKEFRLI